MLEICNITKQYDLKDQKVEALKGVTMRFRRSEFVAILGPSGCGKTTLLNVIGGLDRYTDGDLIIDGVSTKNYKDKDWDNYRNHRVGFVFQSYNLIPHQSILENVELALTLSGVKRKERRARAVEVLNKVGLGDKLKSKPNQLSGGQMQRVAIARALVNDPEIILADEPTGALDSKTSVQIMDLLKEVSKDRLVVMVTHNPELANTYSTRIIRLLDGELIEDSKPYSESACKNEIKRHQEKIKKQQENEAKLLIKQKQAKNNSDVSENLAVEKSTFKKTKKKKSMSFFTALFLSFKNLLTKKGRTIMVAFAGSIGIVGIALILAVSAGMTGYINRTQSESLSSYPVTVSAISVDFNKAMNAIASDDKPKESEDNSLAIYDEKAAIMQLGKYNYISKDFVKYVKDYYDKEENNDKLNDYNISYASNLHLITQQKISEMVPNPENPSDDPNTFIPKVNLESGEIKPQYVAINDSVKYSVTSGTTTNIFYEELDKDYVTNIYDVVGNYPTKKDEVALVVNSKSLTRTLLDKLGFDDVIFEPGDNSLLFYHKPLDFDDIIGKKTYNLLYNDGYYNLDGTPKEDFTIIDSSKKQNELAQMLANKDNCLQLTVTAILIKKDDVTGSIFDDGIMYTHALMDEYRENCKNSLVVQNVKKSLTNQDGSLNYSKIFPMEYSVNITELAMIVDPDEDDFFVYDKFESMKNNLAAKDIKLSDNDLLDLYLQVYGASDVPTGIYFYASTFDAKDDVKDMVEDWNAYVDSQKDNADFVGFKIYITDSSQFLTGVLSNLVNIISYVLVAFAAISLVVSSIMIGIITYTSVIERTKEIGILRSVGASKLDVFRVFTAETVIIGLAAGLIGVGVASILSLFVSILLKSLTGVGGLAIVQPLPCIVLVLISVLLTFIAGLIPSRIATKKDPVKALRVD